jgi:hypothetical protein
MGGRATGQGVSPRKQRRARARPDGPLRRAGLSSDTARPWPAAHAFVRVACVWGSQGLGGKGVLAECGGKVGEWGQEVMWPPKAARGGTP